MGVVADVGFVAGFRNGDDARLPQYPRDSDLRRSRVVTFGNFLKRRVVKQPSTTADRRISHDGNLISLAPGQEVRFNGALADVIENLIG